MSKILWLASWYPNEMDFYAGDFIKRQAEAVSLKGTIDLIYVGKGSRQIEKSAHSDFDDSNKFENLHERILYYFSKGKERSFATRLKSFYRYFMTYLREVKKLEKDQRLPDLVHVQVAMRAGIVALYLKWRYKIPYIVTEHWTGYYPESRESLLKKSFFEQRITISILKNASALLPVSRSLGEQIYASWAPVYFKNIPNTVNTKYFFYEEKKEPDIFRFIHVSSLKYQKNPEAIVRTFVELHKSGFHAEMIFVGPATPGLVKIIEATGLNGNQIKCTGELSYQQVAIELKKSNALVMFSHYETQCCVILEALCSGVPVISSRVGGVPEIVDDKNGILVEAGNEDQLLRAMQTMMKQYKAYDNSLISKTAILKFSYESVAEQIIEVYDRVLNETEKLEG